MLRRARIVAILLAFIPLPAAFAQNTVDLETYREAGAKFVSLVADAEQKKEQNRLRTAEADRLVAVLSDEQHLLKTGQYNANELGELLDLCGVSNRAVMSLALFSLKDQIDPQANPQVIARSCLAHSKKFAIICSSPSLLAAILDSMRRQADAAHDGVCRFTAVRTIYPGPS